MANEERTGTPPYLKDGDGHLYPYNSVFANMAGMVPVWDLPKTHASSEPEVKSDVAPVAEPVSKTLTIKK